MILLYFLCAAATEGLYFFCVGGDLHYEGGEEKTWLICDLFGFGVWAHRLSEVAFSTAEQQLSAAGSLKLPNKLCVLVYLTCPTSG